MDEGGYTPQHWERGMDEGGTHHSIGRGVWMKGVHTTALGEGYG